MPPIGQRHLTFGLVVAAVGTVAGGSLGWPALVYLAKPAATLAVVAIAAGTNPPLSLRYRALIILGLIASLVGDVFLMLPGDWFVAGLLSFLVAHLFYIVAFARTGGGMRDAPAAAAVATVAAAVMVALWSSLGAMRLPVAAYVVVIATMAWQAVARWRHLGGPPPAMAAAGAVLFLVSDSALAIGRFLGPFQGERLVVLATYWAAQYLIASSVRA